MNRIFLVLLGFLISSQFLFSQEDNGVVSFAIPIRNSLKFNQYIINPTFSFVRQQSPIISFYNKKEWNQFDDGPQTYFLSYSGRFLDNQGLSVGLFQHNYGGVLTSFGAVTNFAHNVELEEDNNLTFGMNLGIYNSGLNKGKVITNGTITDPALNNIPSNLLVTISPGINYGTAFFDFGVSLNNLILYNLTATGIVQDDPEKTIGTHVMYTGFIDSYGFFDESKFTGILRADIKKDRTIVSGLAMLTLVKGFWTQAGYNTLYGISAGIGMNITPKISLEYNYEKGMGNLSNFGASHEIVFAYKLFNNNYDDEEQGSIIPEAGTRKTTAKPVSTESHAEYLKYKEQKQAIAAAAAKAKLIEDARLQAEAEAKEKQLAQAAKLKAEADAKAKQIAEAKLKADNEARARQLAEAEKLKAEADAKARQLAEVRAKQLAAIEEANREKQAEQARLKAEADAAARAKQSEAARLAEVARLKAEVDAKAKADADAAAKAKQLAEADAATRAKLEEEARLKAIADADAAAKAKLAEEARLKVEADAKAKADAEAAAKAKLAEEARLKAEADAKAKADADAAAKAKLAEEARLKAEADAKAKADADAAAKAKLAEEVRLKAEADAKAKADADAAAKVKLAEEARLKAEADAKAKADADAAAKAKLAEEARLKAEADAKAKQLAEEARLKAIADAKAKADADLKAKADADAAAKAKLAEEARLKAIADAKAKADADLKAKADAEAAAKAKLAEDARLKAEAEAKAKQLAEAKLKSDADAIANAKLAEEARLQAEAEAKAKLASLPKDDNAKSIDNLTRAVVDSKKAQQDLLDQLNERVAVKEKDLNEMKTDNDLSDKGVFVEPKAFKSVSAENKAIESLKIQIEEVNKQQQAKINQLDNLYKQRLSSGDKVNNVLTDSYLKTITDLKTEQVKAIQTNANLLSSLEKIQVDTEIEKRRRIRRALFNTNQDRYMLDVQALKRIKENTPISDRPLAVSDFDFGEEQSSNVSVIKDIKEKDSGFYLVIAVHADATKRDEFLTKTVASGQSNVDFFFEVKSGKYYIYSNKYDSLSEAQNALGSKADKPYNAKMAIVKIEK